MPRGQPDRESSESTQLLHQLRRFHWFQSSFFRSMPAEPFAASTPPFLAAYLARTLNVSPPNTHRTPTHCHQTTLCPKTTTEIKMLCTGYIRGIVGQDGDRFSRRAHGSGTGRRRRRRKGVRGTEGSIPFKVVRIRSRRRESTYFFCTLRAPRKVSSSTHTEKKTCNDTHT